jgi:hypothetical protein
VALRSALAVLVLACLCASACGGDGDSASPEQVVRDFVKATNDRDSKRLCEDILTPKFIAEATGAKEGDTDQCKQQLKAVTGLQLSLKSLGKGKVDGDKARVAAVLQVQGQRQKRVFQLERHDGDWKLAGGSGS